MAWEQDRYTGADVWTDEAPCPGTRNERVLREGQEFWIQVGRYQRLAKIIALRDDDVHYRLKVDPCFWGPLKSEPSESFHAKIYRD